MTPSSHAATVKATIERSIEVKRLILDTMIDEIAETGVMLAQAIAQGGKLMFCGNGGSAADAQHLAAELLIRLRPDVDRQCLPAMTLAADSSTLTACGNDFGFDEIFSRPLEGLGRAGDVLIGITTSGTSPNVIKALETAREMGIATVGLLGGDGGPARAHCDRALIVPATETGRIQEAHIMIGHILMGLVEDELGRRGLLESR